MNWTPEQLDELLETILPCQARYLYQRELIRLGQRWGYQIGTGPGDAYNAINRVLWGLAVRARGYNGPTKLRTRRHGPLSWAERMLIDWAFPKWLPAESKDVPTVEYIAILLQRSEQEVAAARAYNDDGIEDFGF